MIIQRNKLGPDGPFFLSPLFVLRNGQVKGQDGQLFYFLLILLSFLKIRLDVLTVLRIALSPTPIRYPIYPPPPLSFLIDIRKIKTVKTSIKKGK